jgi:hypothetical protein
MGWNLPLGCTDADIDRACPGYDDEPEEEDEPMKMDARDIVRAITKQNWKHGGALTMDLPEAEALVETVISKAKREAYEDAARIAERQYMSPKECAAAIRARAKEIE